MDRFPLLPKGDRDDNHCVLHVLRESFQDVLHRQPFPENIAENAAKFHMDRVILKEEAETVNTIFDDVQQSNEAFETLENELMMNQGKFMINTEEVEKDEMLVEARMLKRVQVFRNIKAEEARTYILVLKKDLLPTKPEQYIDFRINKNKHWCTLTKCITPFRSTIHLRHKPYGRKLLCPLKECRSELRSETTKGEETSTAAIFQPIPKVIKFTNYLPNKTYTKTLKLKNISNKAQNLVLHTLPTTPIFSLQTTSNISKVAPGMSFHYEILLHTATYKDIYDNISFKTYGGQTLEVKLVCERQPPALQAFVCKDVDYFLGKVEGSLSSCERFFNDSRASALNYTFDCGLCLLGERSRVSLVVRNEGGRGAFFLITEDEWYFGDVQSTDENLELNVDGFEIYPSHFTADRDEFIILQVTFMPQYFGLHAQRCFLLCNNCTYEAFDIIGDGVFFEKHYIKCEVERKKETLSYFDHESEFYIYLGHCLPEMKKSTIISVSNESDLNFPFRWEVRKSVTHNPLTQLKRMNETWIRISNQGGVLLCKRVTKFEVIISANSYLQGLYSIVLGLYIVDVPEASLGENTDFVVVNKNKRSDDPLCPKLLDVLIGEIEIACDIVTANVVLVPPQLILPIQLQRKESVTKEITISTNGDFDLQCKWKVFNKRNGEMCCVKMNPVEFVLKANFSVVCEMTICAHTYDNIREKLLLFVNDGLLTKEYNVLAKVSSPQIEVSAHILDFGYVTINQPLEKRFTLRNLCKDKIQWTLHEFTYDFKKKRLIEIKKNCDYSGILYRQDDCIEVIYEVNAKHVHRWFSFLMVAVTRPTLTILETPILVTYEVCQPAIKIHTPTSTSPILCISELLNIGVSVHAVVCMHNPSNVPAYFLWGSAVGKHEQCVNLFVSPKAGVIKPRNTFKVTVSLKASVTGILEHIYVPCFVGRVPEPVILTVMCAVDNIHVCFSLPINEGKYKKVYWPPQIIDEYNFQPFNLPLYLLGEENADQSVAGPADFDTKSCFQQLVQARTKQNFDDASDDDDDSRKAATSFVLPRLLSLNFHEEAPESTISEESVNNEKPRLIEAFGSDLILEDYHLEIRNVPLRTPIHRKMFMQNLTSMSSSFTAEVTNYEALDVKPTSMEELLDEAGLQKCDIWDRTVFPGNGMVVKITPACQQFYCRQTIEIDISIYANTWGVYIEEVVIEIKNTPPFCFSMVIEVVGAPIEYPFALNSPQEIPFLRLGEIPLGCSELKQRQLKIKNISSIPITIFWHVFIVSKEKKGSFSFVYHVKNLNKIEFKTYCKEEKEDIKLMLTDYHGDEASVDVFQVEPRQLDMLPNTTHSLCIKFSPIDFCRKYNKSKIEALLVGYIDVAEEYRYKPNCFVRATNTELGPTKLNITGTIKLPVLEIPHVKGDLRMMVFASEAMQKCGFSRTQRLIFRNTSNIIAHLSVEIKKPFEVVGLKICGAEKTTMTAAVEPAACVEVFVRCTLSTKDLEGYAEALYCKGMAKAPEYNNNVLIRRYLNIFLKGFAVFATPLEVKIYYPMFELHPLVLNFGNVWIGNCRKEFFTIYNYSEIPIHFTLQLSTPSAANVFVLVAMEGDVPGATGTKRGEQIVEVRFVPNEPKWYNETLRVTTRIRARYKEIGLVANGTINQKFYAADG